jgi:hypothetical protein
MKVGFPGILFFSTARIALIRPDTPAAGSEWPMLLLMDPMIRGLESVRPWVRTDAAAATSTGSPARVPVP